MPSQRFNRQLGIFKEVFVVWAEFGEAGSGMLAHVSDVEGESSLGSGLGCFITAPNTVAILLGPRAIVVH